MELKFYDIVDTVDLHYMVLLNCGVRLYGVVHTVTIECCWYRGETYNVVDTAKADYMLLPAPQSQTM